MNPPPFEAHDPRCAAVFELIFALARGDLTARGEVGDEGDEIDAMVGGLNMLAEELSGNLAELYARNQKLERANDELRSTHAQLLQSAKLASLGEMATGVAHELNQPLGVISMEADLALDLAAGVAPSPEVSELVQSLETIADQITRAAAIINHLRTFGRDRSGAGTRRVPLNDIARASTKLFREQLRVRGVSLQLELSEGSPAVEVDPVRIEQVLINLIANARDAVSDHEDGTITVATGIDERGQPYAEVRDNGPGIPADIAARIFDPFFTTKAEGQGTGLGLSISHGIAADYRGSLQQQPTDCGARMRLTLPKVEALP